MNTVSINHPEPSSGLSAAPVLSADVAARLNALLEAERAGAKVLAMFQKDPTLLPEVRDFVDFLQKDEGHNAVVLFKTIKRLGGQPSNVTGAFVEKILAIEGLAPQLQFLNQGQSWVARKINEVLPLVHEPQAKDMLMAMSQSHVDNIKACEALLARHFSA
jgi:nitronate monooxygenase